MRPANGANNAAGAVIPTFRHIDNLANCLYSVQYAKLYSADSQS